MKSFVTGYMFQEHLAVDMKSVIIDWLNIYIMVLILTSKSVPFVKDRQY